MSCHRPATIIAIRKAYTRTATGRTNWRSSPTSRNTSSRRSQDGDDWRPIGAMQIIDPHLRADALLGRDRAQPARASISGSASQAIAARAMARGDDGRRSSAALPSHGVTAIIIDPLNSNTRAHKFYQRLGFTPTHRQIFGDDDDCLVHKLTRADWLARHQGD